MPHAAITLSPWHLIIDEARPGYANMARDQALLDLADRNGTGVLRLYRWSPHCLSLGRNEPALKRYHREQIEALSLDVVRRPTGGRAVWHGRELTYAVTAPIERFGSLAQAYHTIHQMLARAVHSLGTAAWLAPSPSRPTRLDAGACFASPAGGEVMVADQKLIGSAQLKQGAALLQHGSLLIDDDQSTVQSVTRGDPPRSLDAPLARLLNRQVSFEEVARAVQAAARTWPGPWNEWEGETELSEMARAHEATYQSEAWTWRR